MDINIIAKKSSHQSSHYCRLISFLRILSGGLRLVQSLGFFNFMLYTIVYEMPLRKCRCQNIAIWLLPSHASDCILVWNAGANIYVLYKWTAPDSGQKHQLVVFGRLLISSDIHIHITFGLDLTPTTISILSFKHFEYVASS